MNCLSRAAAALGMLVSLQSAADAKLYLSQKQALDLAFPDGIKVERRTAFLTKDEVARAQSAARAKLDSALWTFYVGYSTAGAVTGYAYFETHKVRTDAETFMAVLEPSGAVRFVEILSFLEPEDYLPNRRWLRQFGGKGLDDDLFAHRGLRNITGSSLTSEALAAGVRRVLAVHALIQEKTKR